MLLSQRILALSLMTALVFIGVSLTFVLGPQDDALGVSPLAVLVLAAAAVSLHGLLEVVGYRVAPLAPGADASTRDRETATALQSSMIRRFVLAEVLAVGSVAYAFVVTEGGLAIYYVGAALSLVLMVVHVYPWRRPVRKVVGALERGDVRVTPETRVQLGLRDSVPGLREL